MLEAKIVSSLEKVFLDTSLSSLSVINYGYIYKNGVFSFQLVLRETSDEAAHRRFLSFSVEGVERDACFVRTVDLVPSNMPCYPGRCDDDYLRTEPGLFPDLLSPLQMDGKLVCVRGQSRSALFVIDESLATLGVGENDITLRLFDGEDEYKLSLTLCLIDVALPDIDFSVTQWFHYDCLASYYNVPVFSDRHFEIVENFLRTYVKCGNNTILTPIFTPPLDTAVGGERLTAQLVGVRLDENGKYSFDFSLLDRFIDMCERVGIKKYEISHLFTQWGASHAPKIIAKTPLGERRIFGWESDATGEEYTDFLRTFIPSLLSYLKARGIDGRCIFHISDEPKDAHLEGYLAARAIVADLLDGYTITDALSNIDFYLSGAVSTPIPSTSRIEPFLEVYEKEGRGGLWTYYCCSQNVGVSNRYFAMTGARCRYIGVQFYRYRIAGFLQWGYNFYNNQHSCDAINPYSDTTGNYFSPSGDAFSVYPAADGTALESVRINHFREGLEDMRALYLAESLVGRDAVLSLIEGIVKEETGDGIVFSKCINKSDSMLRLRAAVDRLILEHI